MYTKTNQTVIILFIGIAGIFVNYIVIDRLTTTMIEFTLINNVCHNEKQRF